MNITTVLLDAMERLDGPAARILENSVAFMIKGGLQLIPYPEFSNFLNEQNRIKITRTIHDVCGQNVRVEFC